jgi:hypothetical protein
VWSSTNNRVFADRYESDDDMGACRSRFAPAVMDSGCLRIGMTGGELDFRFMAKIDVDLKALNDRDVHAD